MPVKNQSEAQEVERTVNKAVAIVLNNYKGEIVSQLENIFGATPIEVTSESYGPRFDTVIKVLGVTVRATTSIFSTEFEQP